MNQLTLNNGLSISVVSINQWYTYRNIMAGYATRDMNEGIISKSVSQAKESLMHEPVVITPKETIETRSDPYLGPPVRIPEITCVALFRCEHDPSVSEADYTDLPIIWFQDEFAFPIDRHPLSLIKAIDWSKHAVEQYF